jgi:hypothetical protein
MFALQTRENREQFSAAVESLKEELSKMFSAAEQSNSTLSLFREVNKEEVDLLSELNPEKLLYYVKHHNTAHHLDAAYHLILHREGGFIQKKKDRVVVAYFRLVEMTGCCGVVISTGARTEEKFQRRGIGTALNKFRIAIAKAIGYTTMICTAVDDGVTEKILTKNGWQKILSFKNRRTNHPISMYSIMLSVFAEKKA